RWPRRSLRAGDQLLRARRATTPLRVGALQRRPARAAAPPDRDRAGAFERAPPRNHPHGARHGARRLRASSDGQAPRGPLSPRFGDARIAGAHHGAARVDARYDQRSGYTRFFVPAACEKTFARGISDGVATNLRSLKTLKPSRSRVAS